MRVRVTGRISVRVGVGVRTRVRVRMKMRVIGFSGQRRRGVR